MAAEDVILRVHGTEEEGDDGDVSLGYRLIDEGGRRNPPAAAPEKKEPRPSSTSATRQPAQERRFSCTMCTQGFLITLGLLLFTALFVGLGVRGVPHPLLVLICLPIFPLLSGGCLMLIIWCSTCS